MRTYYIPRNLKGETRILTIFTTKGLIYTGIGLFIGLPFFLIIRGITGKTLLSAITILVTSAIGYAIGTFKIPDTKSIKLFRNVGGETIDEVIKRALKFNGVLKMFNISQGKKIYTYNNTKEED